MPICSVTSNRLVLSLREKWTSSRVDDQSLSIKCKLLISSSLDLKSSNLVLIILSDDCRKHPGHVRYDHIHDSGTDYVSFTTLNLLPYSNIYRPGGFNISPPPKQGSFQFSPPVFFPVNPVTHRASPRVEGDPSLYSYTTFPISPARSLMAGTLEERQTMD